MKTFKNKPTFQRVINMKLKKIVLSIILIVISLNFKLLAQPLTLEQFVKKACLVNPKFQEILIEKVKIKYRKDIELSVRDIIWDIEGNHNFNLGYIDNSYADASISLQKLFYNKGAELTAEYNVRSGYTGKASSSSFLISIMEPLLKNSLGYINRLEAKNIELENKILEYQITET